MKTKAEIGQFLKLERAERNVTLDQMAERTGLTAVTLRGLLNGKNDSRLSTVLAVAHELGLELALVPAEIAKSVQHSERRSSVESLVSKALRSQKSHVALPRLNHSADQPTSRNRDELPGTASDRGALTPSDAHDDLHERVHGFARSRFEGGRQ